MVKYEDFKFHPLQDDKILLIEPVKYKDIIIPPGFISDGASVPYIARFFNIRRYRMDYLPCAVIHDYLCDLEEYRKADEYFCSCFRELGINKLTSKIMYKAVRLHHKLKYGE